MMNALLLMPNKLEYSSYVFRTCFTKNEKETDEGINFLSPWLKIRRLYTVITVPTTKHDSEPV
jgi:hypothetical protein